MKKYERLELSPELFAEGFEAEIWKDGTSPMDLMPGLRETHDFVDWLRTFDTIPFVEDKRGLLHSNFPLAMLETIGYPLSETPLLTLLEVSPQIRTFTDVCLMLKLPPGFWNRPREVLHPHDRDSKLAGEAFNSAVERIRKRASSPSFDLPVRTRRDAAQRDLQGVAGLIGRISRGTQPVFVHRFDLLPPPRDREQRTASDVKRWLAKLLNAWRRHEEHSSVVAYLWKLQYGLVSGYHIHFTALLHERVMADSEQWIEGVTRLWQAGAGGGAVLRRYQADRHPIFGDGAGLWTDDTRVHKSEGLLRSWTYLLLKDMYFRAKTTRRQRRFGKSETGATKPKAKPISPQPSLSVRRARRLIKSLQRTKGLAWVAAKEADIPWTPALQMEIARWKRLGIPAGINAADFTDEELQRLLFDRRTGKFSTPDFAAILKREKLGERLYPLWLEHFRTATGRPHYPATFWKALVEWSGASAFRIEHVQAHLVASPKDLRDIPKLRRPGVKLELIWDPFFSSTPRGRKGEDD